MKVVRSIAAAVAIAASAAGTAAAEPLRVCHEEWSPFATVVDGRSAGLMIEIVDRALAATGREAAYSQQPYLRCIGSVRAGDYDAILMSSDEHGLVPAGVSVAFWEAGVIARPDWPAAEYGSLSDFAGATVGLVGAYQYHRLVDAAQPTWTVHYAADALFNLRMTARGRIDAMIADIPWARIEAAREGLPIKVLEPTLFATPQYLYFHPGKATTAADLGPALQALIEDGTVDRLYRRVTGGSFQDARARAAAALARD
jgi:ABC-type amino acid transport substrate-binding protein